MVKQRQLKDRQFNGKFLIKKTKSYLTKIHVHNLSLIITLFFCLFRATPTAYGHSQARGPIGAVANDLCHSHSNSRTELCLRPTPQLDP